MTWFCRGLSKFCILALVDIFCLLISYKITKVRKITNKKIQVKNLPLKLDPRADNELLVVQLYFD